MEGWLPHSSGTCHAQTLSSVDSSDRRVTPRASWLVPCQGEDYNDHCLQLHGNHPGPTSQSWSLSKYLFQSPCSVLPVVLMNTNIKVFSVRMHCITGFADLGKQVNKHLKQHPDQNKISKLTEMKCLTLTAYTSVPHK